MKAITMSTSASFLTVKFVLDWGSGTRSTSAYQPLFLRLRRRAYFTSALDALFAHFQQEQEQQTFGQSEDEQSQQVKFVGDLDQIWLSYGHRPLLWEVPVGVAFDQLRTTTTTTTTPGNSAHTEPDRPTLPATSNTNNDNTEAANTPSDQDIQLLPAREEPTVMSKPVDIPFEVIVHPTGRPQQVAPCNEDRLRPHFMNTLKQASFLRFGSANPIMEMNKETQAGLWEGLKKQNMVQVEQCLKLTGFDTYDMRFIPVRLFVAGNPQPIQLRIRRYFQDSASCGSGIGSKCVTLADLLSSWLPDLPLPNLRGPNEMVRCVRLFLEPVVSFACFCHSTLVSTLLSFFTFNRRTSTEFCLLFRPRLAYYMMN